MNSTEVASVMGLAAGRGTRRRAIGLWLVASALMVFAMMLIGAVTRLTESGLSMVEWRPLIGWLPPLDDTEWARVFALYRETTQYQLMNRGMSADEFRVIFFWEWLHRLWGRLIGLVYGVPLVWFYLRGAIPKSLVPHLWGLLCLGAAQGIIGWWMVRSGLAGRIEVSPIRLMVHLGLALAILGYLVGLAAAVLWPPRPQPPARLLPSRWARWLGMLACGTVFLTALAGALTAGANAGFLYNEWPLMDGALLPEGIWQTQSGWRNLVGNPAMIQFNHRILAYLSLLAVAAMWLLALRDGGCAGAGRRLAGVTFALAVLQAGMGIATLLSVVWLPMAVLHQAGAALLFCLTVLCCRQFSKNPGWRDYFRDKT